MDERRKEIYKKAFSLWGDDSQENMAIEEMSELTKELCKLKRAAGKAALYPQVVNNIKEEIADVEIIIEQLKLFFGEQEIEQIKEKKLARLEKRISDASTK